MNLIPGTGVCKRTLSSNCISLALHASPALLHMCFHALESSPVSDILEGRAYIRSFSHTNEFLLECSDIPDRTSSSIG